jgi:hypothetical protein
MSMGWHLPRAAPRQHAVGRSRPGGVCCLSRLLTGDGHRHAAGKGIKAARTAWLGRKRGGSQHRKLDRSFN